MILDTSFHCSIQNCVHIRKLAECIIGFSSSTDKCKTGVVPRKQNRER